MHPRIPLTSTTELGVRGARLRRPVPKISEGTNKQKHTHTNTEYQHYYVRLAETRSRTGRFWVVHVKGASLNAVRTFYRRNLKFLRGYTAVNA